MASTNFLPFDPNKENVMGDTEYNSSQQRLNGVQGGIASSKLHNKSMIQTSLVAAAIAQYMVSAGYDALDTDTVAGFADKLKHAILANQTGLAKATTEMVETGTDDTAYITSYLLKHFYDYWRATPDDLTPPITNSTDYITPQLLYRFRPWKKIATLTTSGTYTVPDGVYQILVLLVGGGGSGGGIVKSGDWSGGGGAGGAVLYGILTVTPGQKINYTIGAGGTSTSASSPNGDGGYTIFGPFSAMGGTKGPNVSNDGYESAAFVKGLTTYTEFGDAGKCGAMGAQQVANGESGDPGIYGLYSPPNFNERVMAAPFPWYGNAYREETSIPNTDRNIGSIPDYNIIFQLFPDLIEFFKLGASGASGGAHADPYRHYYYTTYPGGKSLSGGDGGTSSNSPNMDDEPEKFVQATAGKDATTYGGGGGGAGSTYRYQGTFIKGGNGKQGVVFIFV